MLYICNFKVNATTANMQEIYVIILIFMIVWVQNTQKNPHKRNGKQYNQSVDPTDWSSKCLSLIYPYINICMKRSSSCPTANDYANVIFALSGNIKCVWLRLHQNGWPPPPLRWQALHVLYYTFSTHNFQVGTALKMSGSKCDSPALCVYISDIN